MGQHASVAKVKLKDKWKKIKRNQVTLRRSPLSSEGEEEESATQMEQADALSLSSCSSSSFLSWYSDSQDNFLLDHKSPAESVRRFDMFWAELPAEMKHRVLSFLPLLVITFHVTHSILLNTIPLSQKDVCCFALASKGCYDMVNNSHFWKELCLRDLASEEEIKRDQFFARLLHGIAVPSRFNGIGAQHNRRTQGCTDAEEVEREPINHDADGTSKEEIMMEMQASSKSKGCVWKEVYRYWLERVLVVYIVYNSFRDIDDVHEKLTKKGLLVGWYLCGVVLCRVVAWCSVVRCVLCSVWCGIIQCRGVVCGMMGCSAWCVVM